MTHSSLTIPELLELGDLPSDPKDVLPSITNSDGTYLFQEGNHWDFKETWPFSYSDDYFGGLVRLICAFSNTDGGIIIFGVDDKTRKGGRTKTNPNLDRMHQAFLQLTGRSIDLKLKRYQSEECGDVDILLVPRQEAGKLPLRFLSPLGKYRPGVFWIRAGSEVTEAQANDIPTLYLRSNLESSTGRLPLGQLPPSPATIRQFIGRMSTIDRIFDWLINDDEPRAFLHGKGGSGKSTIAYEIFRHLRTDGGSFRLYGESIIQHIIYVSGKKAFLDIENQKSTRYLGNDFLDECGLYVSILLLGGVTFQDEMQTDIKGLQELMSLFLDQNSCFIVIDDIDTLTTAGREAGLDFIHGRLWRSKSRSKVLYTVRNRPSHSLRNSIEVTGLTGKQYSEFVKVCCNQFSVPFPSTSFLEGPLSKASEGRPLVIESIIQLRRSAGNYENAMMLFEKGPGDDVRDYVFEREWSALDSGDRGREILTLLAIYNAPLSFTDICTISRLGDLKVKDAIASVQDMFLITTDNGAESVYALGDLTKAFIRTASRQLDLFETIRARVDKFRMDSYPDSPELNKLYEKLRRATYLLRGGDTSLIDSFVSELHGSVYPPNVSEDPRFLVLRGYAALLSSTRYMDRARADFLTAFDFKFSPDIDYVRRWFEAERQQDMGDEYTRKILQLVEGSKSYDQAVKTEFRSRRASHLYSIARECIALEPERSMNRLFESLNLHMSVYRDLIRVQGSGLRRAEEYSRNTAFFIIQQFTSLSALETMIETLIFLARDGATKLDPLTDPISLLVQRISKLSATNKATAQRAMGRLDLLLKSLDKQHIWLVPDNQVSIVKMLTAERGRLKGIVASF